MSAVETRGRPMAKRSVNGRRSMEARGSPCGSHRTSPGWPGPIPVPGRGPERLPEWAVALLGHTGLRPDNEGADQSGGRRWEVSVIAATQPMPTTHPPPAELYRLTVDQYDRMVRDGAIAEDDPVELLDGIVVGRCPRDRDTTPAPPVAAGRSSRPPGRLASPPRGRVADPGLDGARARPRGGPGRQRRLTDHHPGPADVALVVEVSDSSLARDRGEKRNNHGRAGIPVYWIVNLVDRRLEVYSRPADGSYPPPRILGESDTAELVVDGLVVARIAVADLLPRPTGTRHDRHRPPARRRAPFRPSAWC